MFGFREGYERFALVGAAIVALGLLVTTVAYPWGSTGHRLINLKATMQLPSSMAVLKADSLFYQIHSTDPDGRKNSNDTSFFAEAQRHFVDIDSYPNYLRLPHDRDSVIALYGWEAVKRNGTLPWATQMVLDSLQAQLRRWDTNSAKYTMSDLGHYVADAHQPLHCTFNYDGQITGNSGIHSRYESGMISSYANSIIINPDSVRYVASPLDYVFSYILHSKSLVDSVLQADNYAKATAGWNGSGNPPQTYYAALWQKTQRFTEDQFQRATVALASLWYTAWVNAGRTASIAEFAGALPESFRLEQNYPNPFNPTTVIRFEIPGVRGRGSGVRDQGSGVSDVKLSVYDILGREVAVLVNEKKGPGSYEVQFDGLNLSSGVYFYRLTAGSFVQTRKTVLTR